MSERERLNQAVGASLNNEHPLDSPDDEVSPPQDEAEYTTPRSESTGDSDE